VPKKYLERVGDDGSRSAGRRRSHRFVSFNPGIELVLEAYEQYWRKTPSVKRLIFKTVPDEATRLAIAQARRDDIAYSIRGALAEGPGVRRADA